VVVNLNTLIDEIQTIEEAGLNLTERLWVTPRCHVVMPYHPMIESIFEEARGKARTSTTKRGMGPVYADKVSYNGIRLFDLADEELFAEKLRIQLAIKNPIFEAFGMAPLALEQVFEEKREQYAQIQDTVREPFGLVQETLETGGHLLLEGAQGALLDNNWGSYPYCTASITLAGGAAAGLGIAPRWITRVVGIAKAYTTRVGGRPMPTELLDEMGETIQNEGQEFGTVTGRPRRCGWFDADLVRFTTQLNGATELAITKLDVLDKLPTLKIGVGYRRPASKATEGAGKERNWHYWELSAHQMEECEPNYIEMEGWGSSTRSIRDFAQLPPQAQAYVRKIEELVKVPVRYISVGPEREATIQIPSP